MEDKKRVETDFGMVPGMINENDERLSKQNLCGKVKELGTI